MLKIIVVFFLLFPLLSADDYSFYDVVDECDKKSAIKYYFDKSKNFCYSARPACGQNGDGNKLYDSIKECLVKEMSPNRVRTVNLYCGQQGSPVTVDQGNGESGTYLFPSECEVYGKVICPDNTICFQSLSGYGYCCDPSLKGPDLQKFTFSSVPK
uniref:Uncharacterized protein n=1 Tax=Panagrolaimus superbus TaxID=310955 RepID=A0A914Y5G8_9BILA